MSAARQCSAFWCAPAVAALVPGVLMLGNAVIRMRGDEWQYLPMGIFIFTVWPLAIGYPIALLHMLIAWPLYRWLGRRWALRWWVAVLAGGVIGALPSAVLLRALTIYRRVGEGGATLIAGDLGLPLFLGGCGMVGGFAFWWILCSGEAEAEAA